MNTILGTLLGLTLLLAIAGIKIDREYERGVIFRLGRLRGVKGPGMYWIIPLLDQKAQVDIRTKTVDIAPQEAVTADSVTIKVNAVLYYRILEPSRSINKVENYCHLLFVICYLLFVICHLSFVICHYSLLPLT
ncbi:MAG: hypothetical protein F6K47_29775 [Symploca sp. SIO2E6]|nr:hypothetical protein [Symploca sp. SIO2E6]